MARPFFKLENITLNFSGYEQMLTEYYTVDAGDNVQTFNVVRDLLLWIDYLEELRGVIKMIGMKLDNRLLYLQAFESENKTNSITQKVNETAENKKICAYYEKELFAQIKFLHMAYTNVVTAYNEHIRKAL